MIYLDADTLVVASIRALWDLPLQGAPVAAVSNVTEAAMQPHLAALGFVEPASYFNAGVLLIDLDRWRSERPRRVAHRGGRCGAEPSSRGSIRTHSMSCSPAAGTLSILLGTR